MKTHSCFISTLFLFSFNFSVGLVKARNNDSGLMNQNELLENNKTTRFLENKGQFLDMKNNPVPFVLFKVETPGMNMYITEKGLTYVFIGSDAKKQGMKEGGSMSERAEMDKEIKWARVDMNLNGAIIKRGNIVKENASVTGFNYFYPHCPNGIYGVKEYEKITIMEVYPGIDWVFYNSTKKGVKYDFVVHPGADPHLIQMVYSSKEKLRLKPEGILQIKTDFGELSEQAPETFLNEKKIQSRFKQLSSVKNNKGGYDVSIGFDIVYPASLAGNYFGSQLREGILVIDPQLIWATNYAGNDNETAQCSTVDLSNNVFITGSTNSVNFPFQNAGTYYQGLASVPGGAIILKFNNAGIRLWATYYSGSDTDYGFSIASDAFGNVFVLGFTLSSNFPIQNAGSFFQSTFGGYVDAFILKFDNAGNRLWATYYGGSGDECGNSITTDLAGNVFVTGYTGSSNFPLQNAGTFYQGVLGGGMSDAFILKFDNFGNRLWATFYGGSNEDSGTSLTTDLAGNVFVGGATSSGNLPLQNAGTFFQPTKGSYYDAFILKFDNLGNRLWATFYGGNGQELQTSIATDASGNLFVTGETNSTNLPLQNAGTFFQPGYGGGFGDIFILKFDNLGNRLWGTYFGGSESEKFSSFKPLVVDGFGNLYVCFGTDSDNLTTLNSCDVGGYNDASFNGGSFFGDQFITLFSNSGVLLWATYFGGNGQDYGAAIDVDGNNNLFIAGQWGIFGSGSPGTYPFTNPGAGAYYDNTFHGNHDVFIASFKFDSCLSANLLSVTIAAQNTLCYNQCTGSATVAPTGGSAPYTYFWSPSSDTTALVTGLCAGTHSVTVTDAAGNHTVQVVTISSPSPLSAIASVSPDTCSGSNGTLTVNVSGGTLPYTYYWDSIGQTSSTAVGLAAGNYMVTVTDSGGCVFTQTGAVPGINPVMLSTSATQTSCDTANGTATVTLTGGTAPFIYSWNPTWGTSATVNGLAEGNYTVTVIDSRGCSGTQTITVTGYPDPLANANAIFNTVTLGSSSQLSASGGGTYTWFPSDGLNCTSCPDPIATPAVTTTYCVMVKDVNGCRDTACTTIHVEIPCGDIFIPNAFSPNDDGQNDIACVLGNCVERMYFVIYDRWGEKVFETSDQKNYWDGKYKGKMMNTAVFVYFLDATLENGAHVFKKGNISLLR